MAVATLVELLDAGVHFGHQTQKWNPKMKQYIFGAKNGIYIIDLRKTSDLLDKAYEVVRKFASQGKNVLFVGLAFFSICMFSLSYKNSYFAKFLEHIGKKFNIIFSISLPIYIYHYFVVMKCGPYLQNSFPYIYIYIYIYIFIVLFISALMHILYKKRGYVYNFINKVIHEYQEKK